MTCLVDNKHTRINGQVRGYKSRRGDANQLANRMNIVQPRLPHTTGPLRYRAHTNTKRYPEVHD